MVLLQFFQKSMATALLWGGFSICFGANLDGVFDAGWTTAYQSADSINHMHQRLHDLGMEQVVLQYAAVEKNHLYYPSELDFLQNTQYKNNQLFPKSVDAAKSSGNRLWLGLYYNGDNWYTPPTAEELDTLAARNLLVLDELYALYGSETVIEGVYIPQEIARYYWDGLRSDATPQVLADHFLNPVTQAAQAKGWKVMVAPFYNQNLENPDKLQSFFVSLFAAGFKPDVMAVQDGIGASDAGKTHADISTVEKYERAVAQACEKSNVDFWVDLELFRTDDSHALAENARIVAQVDSARDAGAKNVIAYDLAVLGNSGLDSLEKWMPRDTSNTESIGRRSVGSSKMKNLPKVRYYKINGARVKPERRNFRKNGAS